MIPTIKVQLISNVDEQSIDFTNIAKTPDMAFRQYYKADDEVWQDYLERFDLIYKWQDFSYLGDLDSYIDTFVKELNEAIQQDISHFDPRLGGGFSKRTINDALDISDWEVVIYDISELGGFDKERLKESFFHITTPSLFDFRELIGDNLVITSCRKAISDRDDEIKIVRSKRGAYYPNSTTRNIAGCNFITAQQTVDILTKTSLDVVVVFDRNGIETTLSKEEILKKEKSFYDRLEQEKREYDQSESTKILNELRSMQEVRQEVEVEDSLAKQVKEEIRRDFNKQRGSLKPDSLNSFLHGSNIQTPTLKPTSELTTDEEIEQEFESERSYLITKKHKKDEMLYAQALEVQQEAITLAYKLLSDGQTFREMNSVLYQYFAKNGFVSEIVNLYLSKELKLAMVKEHKIKALEEYITQLEQESEAGQERIKRKEDEISKLRSTMQKKEIDHRKALDTLNHEITEQTNIATESMDIIEQMNKYKEDMDSVVIELDGQNNTLKEQITAKDKEIATLQADSQQVKQLQQEVKTLSDKLLQAQEKINQTNEQLNEQLMHKIQR